MRWKSVIKSVVPPIMVSGVRRIRQGPPAPPEWEVVSEGWNCADARVKGWDVKSVADAQRRKWPQFCQLIAGTAALDVSHEAPEPEAGNLASHNAIMSFAYVLARAAQGRPQVSLLDWGSGVGHYLELSRALLPGVEIDYHGRDLPELCAAGRELHPGAQFHESDEPCWERQYDLVLVSSSLQYAEAWRPLLGRLAGAAKTFLFITRLPVVMDAASFVVVQRVYPYGYDTEYLGWVFNQNEFLEQARRSPLTLDREFLMADRPVVQGAPEQVRHRGYLFQKKS